MSARSIGFGIIFRRFILSIQSKAVSSLVSSLGAHMAHTAAHKAHTARSRQGILERIRSFLNDSKSRADLCYSGNFYRIGI